MAETPYIPSKGFVDPAVVSNSPSEDISNIVETEAKKGIPTSNDPLKYESVESTTSFNFANLLKKVKADLKKKYPNLGEKDFIDVMHKTLCTFKLQDQTFEYTYTKNNLGGVRWYVKCPKCQRPSLKLFLPSKYPNREQRYLCKFCHRLKNASLLMGSTKRYKKVVRPLRQLENIKQQLMRKNITPEKAKPLLDDYDRIERELAASPEYRLWRFQKEHGSRT